MGETGPIDGLETRGAEAIGAGNLGLGSELWVGFDTCVRAVEAELLFLFADANAEGELQDHPHCGRGG